MKEKIINNKFLFLNLILFILFVPIISIEASNYKAFLVEKVFGYDKLLITDGFSQYIISYGFECSSLDFYEGETIWIDTYFSPGFYDTIIVEGIFDTKTCTVGNSEEVNLKQYFVVSVIDNKDEVIVEDKYGDKYLVEYGIGCGLSFWRYEGKYIDIDIGGSFLDGIGDRIYLFDSNDDCKLWDAEELSSENWGEDFGGWQGDSTITKKCPENSTLIGDKYFCNEGYVVSENSCITYTQNCQNQYGLHSYGDKNYCYCKSGYEWNSSKTACVKSITCPTNSTKKDNICICNAGYVMRNNECITYTEDCVQQFGPNIYGIKGDAGNSSCYCKEGYKWNISRTACIKSIICPKNSSKIAGECVCDDGYEWDSSGRVCIKKAEEKISLVEEKQYSQKKEDVEEEKPIQLEEQKGAEEQGGLEPKEPKQKKSLLASISAFVGSIFDAVKNFFYRIFH